MNRAENGRFRPGAKRPARILVVVALVAVALLAPAVSALPALANTVSFDPIVGGPWGGPFGNSPGDCIFTEDAIQVCLEVFHVNGLTYFDTANLAPAFGAFGVGRIFEIHNINAVFDLSAVPGNPCQVQFLFLDQGGVENLKVNGAPLIEADLVSLDGVAVAPGVVAHIQSMQTPIGVAGICFLDGPVWRLGVGGQEFFLDDVRTICSDCDHLVSYEPNPIGDTFGFCAGDPPGTLIFSENGVRVFTELYMNVGGPYYDCSRIEWATINFGLWHICRFSNINHLYDFSQVGCPVEEVTFEFADVGGEENLKVNNGPLYVGDIAGVPVNPAPGVTFSIQMTPIPGGKKGIVRLQGPVQLLVIGGQEFWLDNICATCSISTGAGAPPVSAALELAAPRPNPVTDRTTLRFTLPEPGHVSLEVFDVSGRRVVTLMNSWRSAGTGEVAWEGRDARGSALPGGTYFARLRAGTGSVTRKVQIAR